MLHTKYQGSRTYGFRQEDFFMFSLPRPMHIMRPLGRGHFWPNGRNWNKLGIAILGDATYQISRLYAFRFQTKRFFHVFPYIGLCILRDPQGGAIFGPMGII